MRLFLEGAREQLEAIEPALAALSRGQGEQAAPALRRAWHSLKGMSATMGYEGLAGLAHAAEELFRRPLPADLPPTLLTTLGEAYEGLARSVSALERGEAPPDLAPLEARVRQALDGGPVETPAQAPGTPAPLPGSVRVAAGELDGLLAETAELEILLASLPPDAVVPIRRATKRLRQRVARMRLLPFSLLVPSLERRVAEVAALGGKQARLELTGADLRLDRATLEVLLVPLQHLLTNAVDHGLEAPARRRGAGQDPVGRVQLRLAAGQETLRVTVQDDGSGADTEALARVAGEAQPAPPPDEGPLDLTDLLCRPGLTTAPRTTATSGRGVGLDAVREAVLRAGGRLTLIQRAGEGLTAELILPLSVSVTSCLLAREGDTTYGIPLASVEVVSEGVPGSGALRLTDLIRGRRRPAGAGAVQLQLRSPGYPQVTVAVDALLGRLDAVVRPLPGRLQAPAVAGTALCGDGTPVIILDPVRLTDGRPPHASPSAD